MKHWIRNLDKPTKYMLILANGAEMTANRIADLKHKLSTAQKEYKTLEDDILEEVGKKYTLGKITAAKRKSTN